MNPLLVFAALLVVAIGIAHSVLGERALIGPLIAHQDWPKLSIGPGFARRTLRFAWHITSLAWFCLAVIIVAEGAAARGAAAPVLIIIAVGFLATGLVAALASRGAHFSWVIFNAIALTLLVAQFQPVVTSPAFRAIVALCTGVILVALSGLHVYWALGGQHGIQSAVPELHGKPLFRPSPILTLIVALVLAGAATAVLGAGGLLLSQGAPNWLRLITFAVSAVFALRVVGDLRFFGMLKRYTDTRFARWDTRFYVPLCWSLAAGTWLVAL